MLGEVDVAVAACKVAVLAAMAEPALDYSNNYSF